MDEVNRLSEKIETLEANQNRHVIIQENVSTIEKAVSRLQEQISNIEQNINNVASKIGTTFEQILPLISEVQQLANISSWRLPGGKNELLISGVENAIDLKLWEMDYKRVLTKQIYT